VKEDKEYFMSEVKVLQTHLGARHREVENLPSKCKVLSSKSLTTKKKKNSDEN
jgi:hypothetical protein